ncbi:MAG: hydroxyacid dehydrogenase [Bacillota bacterium]
MRKVCVLEPIHQDGLNILEAAQLEVIKGWELKPEKLMEEAAKCDGVLIRIAKISGDFIRNAPHLKVIAKHGIGVDNIDVKVATEKKVLVVNAPEANINAVAEHAFAMVMALSKNFLEMDKEVRQGNFALRTKVNLVELKGKKVGIIGLGKIGILLAKKLKGLDVNLLGYDPYADRRIIEDAGIKPVDRMEEVMADADFISVHVPLMDSTRGMIGENEFKQMKNSSYLVDVSRGGVVDQNALYQALKTGMIKGAAVDVFEQEPPQADNPLFELDNILLSPHNAALTDEALVAMATQSAQGIVDCLAERKPRYVVNSEVLKK